jgi:hypothetical protein
MRPSVKSRPQRGPGNQHGDERSREEASVSSDQHGDERSREEASVLSDQHGDERSREEASVSSNQHGDERSREEPAAATRPAPKARSGAGDAPERSEWCRPGPAKAG